MITATPTASISANRIFLFDYLEGIRRGGQTSAKSLANLRDNSHYGKISQGAETRIRAAVNWLYAMSRTQEVWQIPLKKPIKFRLNLITLTLPSRQIHCDRTIKTKVLDPFLKRLRRKYGMQSYIWKAEPQKNGNIHFHITTNCYIHHADLRTDWLECVNALGYLDRYIPGKAGKRPPGTEIKSVRNVKKLAGYIAKYLCKESTVRPICGRNWFLSSNLSQIKPVMQCLDRSLNWEIERLVDDQKAFWRAGEYGTVIFADIFSKNIEHLPQLHQIKTELLCQHQNNIQPVPALN